MDYRRLISLVVVFVVCLASDNLVLANRRNAIPSDPDMDGSGDLNDFDDGSGGDDAADDGSSDGDFDIGVTRNPSNNALPTVRNRDHKDQTIRIRTTTSVYINNVEIGHIDESDENVKVESTSSFFTHPAVLAAIVVGGAVTILFIVLLIIFLVHRMRKKDEGSYVLDDPKAVMVGGGYDFYQQPQPASSLVYIKSPTNNQYEFYA